MEGMVIDCFAGGGGASQGIEEALGRSCDVAVNHDPRAIAMHKANHPATHHMTEDIWEADLAGYAGGRHVGLMWASPDCTHFSRAKGAAPRESGIRMLPWAVHKHAKNLEPDVIIMENVAEIQQWGPLGDDGRPLKAEEGKEYGRFVDHMRDLGYDFECRELVAADYGAPTSRKRWYAVMRRDGKRISWPERDHAPRGSGSDLEPYVPAASVIDWSLPRPSVFASRAQVRRAYGLNAVRPLAGKTMRRVARGLDRFALSCPDPYLEADGGALSFLTAFYGGPHGGSVGQSLGDPLRTITTAAGAHFGIVSAMLGELDAASGRDPSRPPATASWRFEPAKASRSQDLGRWPQIRALLNEHCGYRLGDDEVLVATIGSCRRFVADIGLRMLTPEELKLAQGFPRDYVIDRYFDGSPVTKSQQVKMIGNSVVPVMARRIVATNVA